MSRVLYFLLILALGTQISYASPARILPDSDLTPGAANPDVTPETINQTICNPNWKTRTIRPPVSYTGALKREQIQQYGYDDQDPKHYEEDHLIPLWLGGHPSDPRNLWPESYLTKPGARDKDKVENWIHWEVCSGRLDLRGAQWLIATDWTVALGLMRIQKRIEENAGDGD